ncbi:MAG: DUF1573 domain-containing protein, partial [Bacteroidales bacterium]|nr:DUF1573 domain-containing protein [Bacteroidales bacterium]
MKKILVILIIMLPILSMAQNKAHIQFENINHDYGEIAVRANGDHGFVFTNTGSAPLVINEVVTSCGCTAVAWPKKPLPVGSSDSIVIKYDTR